MSAKRNGEIEFLRFVFASIVVFHHSYNLFGKLGSSIFTRGSFAVEFFFIVSGFLLMKSVSKCENACQDPGMETIGFLKKKISSLYPELLLAEGVGLIFVLLTNKAPLKRLLWIIGSSIPSDLFFIGRTGLGTNSLNGPVWYISTMLITMMIMYPLLRKWKSVSSKIVIPILSFLCIGYLWKSTGSVLNPSAWMGLTFKGNIRGFGEIGFGIIAFYLSQWIGSLKLNKFAKILLTLIKWACFATIIIWMAFFTIDQVQILLLIMYVVGISIVFANHNCIDSKLFDHRIFLWLGKISTPLFLCHFFFCSPKSDIASLNNILPAGLSKGVTLCIYYLVSLAVAIFISITAETIRKKKLLVKIGSLFIMK